MKKIYVSADIEGIWGNSNPVYTMRGGAEYEEYRKNMIHEVNLVIDLLFKNGADEVVVNDSHGNMDNLLPSEMDPRASFIISNGAYKEYGMMEGLDETFSGVCLIGYHGKANSEGVMSHTNWGAMIHDIRIDGVSMGESGINACLAREFGVPVILIAGDSALKKQVKSEFLEDAYFVQTKQAINNQCALCCSKNELVGRYDSMIQKAMHSVFENVHNDLQPNMEITFHHKRNADFVSRMSDVTYVGDCKVSIEKPTFKELYQTMRFVIMNCNNF